MITNNISIRIYIYTHTHALVSPKQFPFSNIQGTESHMGLLRWQCLQYLPVPLVVLLMPCAETKTPGLRRPSKIWRQSTIVYWHVFKTAVVLTCCIAAHFQELFCERLTTRFQWTCFVHQMPLKMADQRLWGLGRIPWARPWSDFPFGSFGAWQISRVKGHWKWSNQYHSCWTPKPFARNERSAVSSKSASCDVWLHCTQTQ